MDLKDMTATQLAGAIHGLGTALVDAGADHRDVDLCYAVAAKLESQAARVAELEAELARLREPWKGLTDKESVILENVPAFDFTLSTIASALRRCMASRAELEALLLCLRTEFRDPANRTHHTLLQQCKLLDKLDARIEAALAGEEVNR